MQSKFETPRHILNYNQGFLTGNGIVSYQLHQSQEHRGRESTGVAFTKMINYNEDGKRSWLYTAVDSTTEPSQSYRTSRRQLEFSDNALIYKCAIPGCNKVYRSLSHLNAHIGLRGHGPKRKPSEFVEFRN